jgi:hypothetical protein
MADLIPLFTSLLSELRTSLTKSSASFSEVEELLYDGTAASLAQKLIDEKRQKGKLTEVFEADLWHALIESILEASSADETNAYVRLSTQIVHATEHKRNVTVPPLPPRVTRNFRVLG